MQNTRLAILVSTGERHALRELDGTITLNLNLNAVGIELRTAAGINVVRRIGLVQGNELGADEVAVGLRQSRRSKTLSEES